MSEAALSNDIDHKFDDIGSDWNAISNHPTTLTGYGITDAVKSDDPRLSDARTPLAHTQEFSTITSTPTTLAGYGITDTLTNTVNGKSGEVNLTTSEIPEGTHEYFTADRHDYTTLKNLPTSFTPSAHTQEFSTITNTPTTLAGYGISDAVSSSIVGTANGLAELGADGKLKSSQIPTDLLNGMRYQGTWDASANLPAIGAAITSNKGFYYVVAKDGTTPIDGVADWKVSDWIVSDGDKWVKIDNTDKVSSVNGQVGTVNLTTSEIPEGANQYFSSLKVLETLLSGFATGNSGAVTATDSLLAALEKIETRLAANDAKISALPIVYQATSRYPMITTTGQEVWAHSSSKAYGNLPWTRTGTTLTINQTNNNRVVGDRVIIRNTNEDYLVATVATVAPESWTVACNDIGATSGSAGQYSLGFNFAHIGAVGSITGGTLSAPAGENVQLISLRIHIAANTRATTTYNITLPQSATNGAGANTSNADIYFPTYMVRQDADSLAAVSATLLKNISGSYNTFQLGALSTVPVGLYLGLQF
jgi:hypothetical protein